MTLKNALNSVANSNPALRFCCVFCTCNVSKENKAWSVNVNMFCLFRKFECNVNVICPSYKVISVVQRKILFVFLWVSVREFIADVRKWWWCAILFVNSECCYYFMEDESQHAWTIKERDFVSVSRWVWMSIKCNNPCRVVQSPEKC
jgi:Na+/melibiose symporter-like transporter